MAHLLRCQRRRCTSTCAPSISWWQVPREPQKTRTYWEGYSIAILGLDRLDILRHANSWKGPGGLAVFPLLSAPLVKLLSNSIMPWGAFSWQHSIVEAVLLGILLVGVTVATRKRFPLWSVSWIILTIITGASLLAGLALIMLGGPTEFRGSALALFYPFSSLLVLLVVLAFSLSQAGKGLRFTFFVVAVYLVSSTLGFTFVPPSYFASLTIAIAVLGLLTIATVFELIVIAAMVMSFVIGDSKIQRGSLWVLVALILIDPIFNGWYIASNALDAGLLNLAGIIMLPTLLTWIFAGVMFLIAWRLGILVAYLDEKNNRNDPIQGANNAS